MTHTKIASIGMTGILALSLGLAACGNSGSTSTASTESTSTEDTKSTKDSTSTEETTPQSDTEDTTGETSTTSETDAIPAFDHVGYWSGESSDGGSIYYNEDSGNGIWEVVVVPGDSSNVEGAILVNGVATKTDEGITITDINTDEVADVTFISESDTELVVKVGDAKATLTPCSPEDFLAGEDAVFAIQASAE